MKWLGCEARGGIPEPQGRGVFMMLEASAPPVLCPSPLISIVVMVVETCY